MILEFSCPGGARESISPTRLLPSAYRQLIKIYLMILEMFL